MNEYRNALSESDAIFARATTDEERRIIRAKFHRWRNTFIVRLLAFAEAHPRDRETLDALFFVIHHDTLAERADVDRAVDLLLKDHVASEHLGSLLRLLAVQEPRVAERPLRQVLAKNPHHAVQAQACLSLALMLLDRVAAGPPEKAAAITAEAEELFDRVVTRYADVKAVAEQAGAELHLIRHLAVGKTMPDIKGSDSDGKELKLSDYRGKVVVLTFWAEWCAACMTMVPHERSLVQRLEGKPFALLGVNLDESREALKKCEEQNRMTWRSFFDGPDGPIRKEHNLKSMPTTYILDAQGVIRYKDVRGEALDRAVDRLVAELEKGSGK
jgi:peroxiredoxin